ncbi:MAG: hypothetical protein EOM20_06465 [Spartobacteria bacterium]|nr:hypothetical protein [Spartobacteria bacterium]
MSRRRKVGTSPISLFSFQDLITSLSGILILLVLIMSVQIAIQGEVTKPPPVMDNHLQERLADLREQAKSLRRQLDELRELYRSQGTNDAVATARVNIQAEREHDELRDAIEKSQNNLTALEKQLERARAKETEARNKTISLKTEIDKLRAAQAEALQKNRMFVIPEPGAPKTAVIVECSGETVRAGYIDRATPPVSFVAGEAMESEFRQYLDRLSSSSEYLVFMVKPSGVNVFYKLKNVAIENNFDVGYDALEEERSIALGAEAI